MTNHTCIIQINTQQYFRDIQEFFSNCYKFLKIDFYESNKGIKGKIIDPGTRLSHYINEETEYFLNIDTYVTISLLSLNIKEILPVFVQVSRKSGNVWNEISITDDWTLDTQNKAGQYISEQMISKPKDL